MNEEERDEALKRMTESMTKAVAAFEFMQTAMLKFIDTFEEFNKKLEESGFYDDKDNGKRV